MTSVTFLQPQQLTFGSGCMAQCIDYIVALPPQKMHIVCSPSSAALAEKIRQQLAEAGCKVTVGNTVGTEPTIAMFHRDLEAARAAGAECILGIGGGSALDMAKLLAAFVHNEQCVEDCIGIGFLKERRCHLICVPTTSGTGSEVSPNAILLDEAAQLKKGVISRYLVPDATFIDPELTCSVPSAVTAFTGLDALTHCIEAYTNKFAHPLVDVYALQGITLAQKYLVRAVCDGSDLEAREGMSRASLYGGLCLGPVNTAAVHALAYPLGGEFHLPHGLSNAVLLPAVFRFNALATPERHADVAVALGVPRTKAPLAMAYAAADVLKKLCQDCGLSTDLTQHGLEPESVPQMAKAAMTVTRLLKNNPRELTQDDAEKIYLECFQ